MCFTSKVGTFWQGFGVGATSRECVIHVRVLAVVEVHTPLDSE